MFLKKITFLLIGQIMFCPFFVFSSNDIISIDKKIDSIKNLISNFKNEEAIGLSNNVIEQSSKISYTKGEANGYILKSKALFASNQGFAKALPSLLKAKKLYESQNDSIGIANCYLQIGVLTWGEKLFEQSIAACENAFRIYSKHNKIQSSITAQYIIGLSNIELNELSSAEKSLENAYQLSLQQNDTGKINEVLSGFANLEYNKENFLKSKAIYFQIANSITKIKNIEAFSIIQTGIGKNYLALHQLDSAEIYLSDSYKESKKTKFYIGIIESSKYLTKLYKQKNDYKNLSKFQEIYFETKDSLSNQQTARAVTELLNQVVINDKQSEINSLSTQQKIYQIWMLVLGIVILFGSLVIYLFYKNNRTKELLNKQLTTSNEELIQSQVQILKLQKYKESFLANITHELRTPLNAIKGISDLLSFSNNEDEKKELVNGLKKSSNHLLNMVNDFLDFSKLKEGKLTLRRQPFQLQSVIKSATNLLKVNAEEKQLAYTLSFEQMPETVMGDESRLIQILVNIIGNSIKFTATGFVKIVCKGKLLNENKCEIEIRISDSGIGISAEKIKSIFEDYEQADENIAATFGGTGLGLGICKRLIEQHQGTITCESELGKGTTFTIKLPYEYLKINEIEIKDLQNFDSLTTQKINIIIADDNEMNLLVAEKLIGKNMPMAKLLRAENGKQVIDLLEKNAIDLILMDMKMPVMNGIEATQIIRANKSIIQPHIIAMTAGTSEDDITECYQAGMNDYLPKPYHIEVLLSKIQKVAELISNN